MDYKVLITTSGVGSRLGDLTKYTNKSLVRVGCKPALSYVIEAYPSDVELVITVGYYAEHVKEFVRLAYPDRKISFIDIDKYDGSGSSLGYSMLQAKDLLQMPFIYHACDTIVAEKISAPNENWSGGCRKENASMYASFDVMGEHIQEIKDKGAIKSDFMHIGLVGIFDYQNFWSKLEKAYRVNPADSTLNDCMAINAMIKEDSLIFKVREFDSWLDIGNVESLNQARQKVKNKITVLDKIDESIFIFNDFVIKFFADTKMTEQRVKRANILKGLVPEIEGSGNNFYRYKYAHGDLYSRVVNPLEFSNFLNWSKDNLWKIADEVSQDEFKQICYDFYGTKTLQRVDRFMKDNAIIDGPNIINGEAVPSFDELYKMIDFDLLTSSKQCQFHGDFILDNIIKTDNNYCLLDWRQNFGGLLKSGDIYYDLAKLNHNLTVNHDIVDKDLFIVNIKDSGVRCDILRKNSLVQCQQVLEKFVIDNGFDLRRVRLLTAIIWLNMSPLHHHPFNLFLFYFGKLNLWKAINEK